MYIMLIPSFIIGIAIIILTVMRMERGLLKVFLLTAGASLAGFPVFALLHNAVYGVFIQILVLISLNPKLFSV